jgi:ribonuclease HI
MDEWIYKWCSNGWKNAAGHPVANQDLIREASELDDRARELGDVTYEWLPREQNQLADAACNRCLDDQEDGG